MSDLVSFPSAPGTYVLLLRLNKTEMISVGMLGSWEIAGGYYAYIGSAQGPGGLAGRLNRHLRPIPQKPQHWHIDSLSSVANIIHVWWQEGSINHECTWAEDLAKTGSIPIPCFGSSDCRCPGHLIWLHTLTDQPHTWQNLIGRLGTDLEVAKIEV